jgi:adenylate cyclase class 2
MKEIERKILEINKKEILKRLKELKAKKVFQGLVKVVYLDTPSNEIRRKGNLLRIREFIKTANKSRYVEIVYKTGKKIVKGCKVYDEFTFKGKNFHEAVKFFENLGFSPVCRYEKKRMLFKLPNAEIVIDEYPKIPPFIEIEAKSSKIIDNIVSKLHLQKNESSAETINQLLKRKYPNIKLNNLTFS